jgi:WD40 repeat protein
MLRHDHNEPVQSLAFSPQKNLLATASAGGTVRLWELETYSEIATLSGHRDVVRSVAFSLDRKLLATGSQDETVRLWDPQQPT